jgi:acetyltransferase
MAQMPISQHSHSRMKNGMPVTIRPIQPEDEPLMVKFHETLSDRTVYLRYFGSLSLNQRVAHERLRRICADAQGDAIVLVADYQDTQTGEHSILGVGRVNPLEDDKSGEVAVLISDKWQGQGLGTALLERLVSLAREWKLSRLVAEMMRDNLAMQTLLKRFGFRLSQPDYPGFVHAIFDL